MQIIAGKHRGRKLSLPPGADIRPTSSMAREAIFNILMHAPTLPDGSHRLRDNAVADICCGSGAMGLEALSRGAAFASFIDKERAALDLVRESAERFGEGAASNFLRAEATNLPNPPRAVSVAFVDPPYKAGLMPGILKSILAKGWLMEGGWVVAEMSAKDPVLDVAPFGFDVVSERSYGSTRVMFLEKAEAPGED